VFRPVAFFEAMYAWAVQFTVTLTVVECVSEPETPVIVRV
jgi:hypothetical protein